MNNKAGAGGGEGRGGGRGAVFPSGLSSFDSYLGGGLLGSLMIEISGASGVGKTQFAYTLIREALRRNREACAMIFQSEGTCAVERLAEICQHDEQILARVMVEHVDTKETLIALLEEKIQFLNLDVILIDSVASLYRFEDSYVDRGASMLKLTQILKHQLTGQPLILCINQVTRDGHSPALGLLWSNCVNIRLKLERDPDQTQRTLFLDHHPLRPGKAFPILLQTEGFVE